MNRRRAIALGLALLALGGLFVLGGADVPFPYSHEPGPEDEILDSDYDQYVGTDIATSGTVIEAEERLVRIDHDAGAFVITLDIDHSHDITLSEGDEVTFSGTIEADHTISVTDDHHIATRAPWERVFMYAISVFAAILTTLLVANYWRVDPTRVVLEPRDHPLVPIRSEDRTDG